MWREQTPTNNFPTGKRGLPVVCGGGDGEILTPIILWNDYPFLPIIALQVSFLTILVRDQISAKSPGLHPAMRGPGDKTAGT